MDLYFGIFRYACRSKGGIFEKARVEIIRGERRKFERTDLIFYIFCTFVKRNLILAFIRLIMKTERLGLKRK